jgi:O-antigen ligase
MLNQRADIFRRGLELAPDGRAWLRGLVVVGLLLLSFAATYVVAPYWLLLAVFASLGGILVIGFLRWPSLGLIAACLAGMIFPWHGPSGLNASMLLIALVLGLWLLDLAVHRGEAHALRSQTMVPLMAFLAVSLLAFGVGQLPWFTFAQPAPLGAQLGGLAIILLSAGTLLLAATLLRERKWLRLLTWFFLLSGFMLVAARGILPAFGLPTRSLFLPMGSVFFVWLIALAASQALFNKDLHAGWRLALAALVGVTLYYLVLFKFADKSGWLPVLVGVGAIVALRSWRLGLLMGLVAALTLPYLSSRVAATDEYSIATRFDAWVIMFQIIKVSPVWGLGFANYYWYTPLFPIRGYAVSFNSHNNYVDIVAQTGLVGLICLLLFFVQAGRLIWRLHKSAPAGFDRAYVLGAFGGLAGMAVAGMLGDWVLPFFYNVGMDGFRSSMIGWLFLGALLALDGATRETSQPAPAEASALSA